MMKKLNIALLGYGKMGREIEKIAIEKGHAIIAKIDNTKDWQQQKEALLLADVAIDFSVPESAKANMVACFDLQLPLVVGTTAWYQDLDEMTQICQQNESALLWASNFSIGVNLLLKINSYAAELMSQFPQYQVSLHEIHHTQKLDAPSGTAITIAQGVLQANNGLKSWRLLEEEDSISNSELPITYERIGQVSGTHILTYTSEVDEISIKHEAKSRAGFAIGAVLAAEWLIGKTGVFTMEDVLA